MAKRDRIIMIVDRSGSMQELADEASKGINDFVKAQRKLKRPCDYKFVQFDNKYEAREVCDLNDVEPYQLVPGAMTALLDAVGRTMADVDTGFPGKKYKHNICVIVTDGAENASREWSWVEVQKLIARREKQGWEFVFMASNIDAPKTAVRLGVNEGAVVAMSSTGLAQGQAYGAASDYTGLLRSGVSKSMATAELDETKLKSSDIS